MWRRLLQRGGATSSFASAVGCLSKAAVDGLNLRDNLARILVLPEPKDREAQSLKMLGRVNVSDLIPSDLGQPEVPTGLWFHEVLGTSVPVATVNEDVQPRTGKRDVSAAPSVKGKRLTDPESHAVRVQHRANHELRLSIAPAVRLHVAADSRRNGRIIRGIPGTRFCRSHSVPFTRHAADCAG
jgi:hypothetical protein